ncbi:MAG: L-fucose mutarotase [Desulfobacterales bacterium]|nr:MAG: L-fucose mutarotase [Desulfobacterales bacterium]
MLKGIPCILSPMLLKILMEMGHGDDLVLADGNFPSESFGKRVVRADGHGIAELLRAILNFFPLDTYVEHPVTLMAVVAGDRVKTPIWEEYKKIVKTVGENTAEFEYLERFAFYEKAKDAYAVVATSEKALYANIILKKGVVV